MSATPRHELDDAIDRVAAKMVAIDDDAGALQAAIRRLPDRRSKPWFLRMPVQLAAAAALVMMAFVFARPSDPPVMPITAAPSQAIAPPPVTARMVLPDTRPPDVPAGSPRSLIPDPSFAKATDGRPRSPIPDPRSDHEHSLAPVAAIEAIELSEIGAPALELDAPASLEPLVLTDLSLETKGDS